MSASTRRSVVYRVGLSLLALLVVVASFAMAHVQARAQSTTLPPPPLGLSLSASTVKGGNSVTGTVTFRETLGPFSGATVTLSSNNTAVATVPASIYLPASLTGFSKATFTVTTYKVTANKITVNVK